MCCNSCNLIYVLICSGCNEEYIDETGDGETKLRDRGISSTHKRPKVSNAES